MQGAVRSEWWRPGCVPTALCQQEGRMGRSTEGSEGRCGVCLTGRQPRQLFWGCLAAAPCAQRRSGSLVASACGSSLCQDSEDPQVGRQLVVPLVRLPRWGDGTRGRSSPEPAASPLACLLLCLRLRDGRPLSSDTQHSEERPLSDPWGVTVDAPEDQEAEACLYHCLLGG